MSTARRRSDSNSLEMALKLGGLLMILAVVHPTTRQHLHGIALVVAILVCVGLLVFLALRRRSQKAIAGHPASSAALAETATGLLHQLRHIDWFQFEKVVGLVYRKLGYSVERRGGANPDGGIDLVITKDGETTGVQCKHWKTWEVGVKTVREFLGALTDAGLKRGALVTLGGYTAEAAQLAPKHDIKLIDETGLLALFTQTDARFDPAVKATLADDREFCPKCEREMVLRTAAKGSHRGEKFWGCSAFPRCRFTFQA